MGPKITEYSIKNLKKNTCYKVKVQAFVIRDGVKSYVGDSYAVHTITGGETDKETVPKSIRAKQEEITLAMGAKAKAEADVKPLVKGKKIFHRNYLVRYKSENPAVATVEADGTVTAVAPGSCRIYLIAINGMHAEMQVTVEAGPESISFKKAKYTVKAGKTLNLLKKLKVTPKGAPLSLKWKSSDRKIAAVDKNGVVTAKKKGTVTITVTTSNGLTATVKIRVR